MPRSARKTFYCYMLMTDGPVRKTYIGYTVNLKRRLDQHTRAIGGGARATHISAAERNRVGRWRMVKAVSGFKSTGEALSFEYYWKHAPSQSTGKYRSTRGVEERVQRLHSLLQDAKWSHIRQLSEISLPVARTV
jgi:predicted GIY-YIG superfamily endonuclease